MPTVFVALGSNLDHPVHQLERALVLLAASPELGLVDVSSFWRTPPWGPVPQPDYLNAVCQLTSPLSPSDVLARLLEIETYMGRQRRERWGPRRIDLDLLAVDQQVICTPDLQLPHPRLAERAFVLLPWAELAPDFRPWVQGPTVAQLLERLPATDRLACCRLETCRQLHPLHSDSTYF